jgi:hypothetical protein
VRQSILLGTAPNPPTDTGGQLVAVLGASNVARGLPWLLETVRRLGPDTAAGAAPRDLLVAGGHGRSYGLATNVLGRTLPGLLDCGIWTRLDELAQHRTLAVVLTDVGNDLVYEVPPERLVGWVRSALDRLPRHARVTVTTPPLASLSALSPWRFHLLRRLFFPARRVELSSLLGALERVVHGLSELAADPRVRLVEPPASWYGFDPIHTLSHRRVEAWYRMLGEREDREPNGGTSPPGLSQRWLAMTARPQDWRLFGLALGSAQPCRRLADGTRLWLY